MPFYPDDIEYSEKYKDQIYEYRHVILPKALAKRIKGRGILMEHEWRGLGIRQSEGWVHYGVFNPEPHILLFRRPLSPVENPNLERDRMMEELRSREEIF